MKEKKRERIEDSQRDIHENKYILKETVNIEWREKNCQN